MFVGLLSLLLSYMYILPFLNWCFFFIQHSILLDLPCVIIIFGNFFFFLQKRKKQEKKKHNVDEPREKRSLLCP